MSTRTKLDPLVRQQRMFRRNLLRHPPRLALDAKADDMAIYGAIMERLANIYRKPSIHGADKHKLFIRGSLQIAQLKVMAPI